MFLFDGRAAGVMLELIKFALQGAPLRGYLIPVSEHFTLDYLLVAWDLTTVDASC